MKGQGELTFLQYNSSYSLIACWQFSALRHCEHLKLIYNVLHHPTQETKKAQVHLVNMELIKQKTSAEVHKSKLDTDSISTMQRNGNLKRFSYSDCMNSTMPSQPFPRLFHNDLPAGGQNAICLQHLITLEPLKMHHLYLYHLYY